MQTIVSAKDQYALKKERHLILEGIMQGDDVLAIANHMHTFDNDRWHHSRDIFRSSKEVQKALNRPSFVSIISQLLNETPYRLAFDQMLFPMSDDVILPMLYHQKERFDTQFCYQGIQLGVILSLEPTDEELLPFTTTPGSAFVFMHDFELSFEPLLSMKKGLFYLLAFGRDPIVFKETPHDPFQNQLRKLGLNFNDKLSNKLHPQFFTKT